MSTELTLLALAMLLIAALVKSILGFGESLLAIPVLSMLIGVQITIPVMALLAGTITLLILFANWRDVDFVTTRRLTIAAVIGVPVGALALRSLPVEWIAISLGLLLIVVGVIFLSKPDFPTLTDDRWGYAFGLVSGILGGAYNMSSPPVIVYGAMNRWHPDKFRVTLQSYFVFVSALILLSHATAGLWTADVFRLYVLAIPTMGAGFYIGSKISKRLSGANYERVVYIAITVLGIAMILQQITR